MKIPFVCLLLLSTTVLSQDADVIRRYRQFINQHINAKMHEHSCDGVIRGRDITVSNSNQCKETNTFILATAGPIKNICGAAGERVGEMTRSLKPFVIVVCTLKSPATRGHCQYRGQKRTRTIAIRCEQGFPVHFDGDIVHFEQ